MEEIYRKRKTLFRQRIKKAKRVDKDIKIPEICSGKSVLDVGCVGQDRHFGDPEWLHDRINKKARDVLGVDIVEEKIIGMKEAGYKAVHQNELKDLNLRFDVVVMADVIEHVDDPVQFLNFYSDFIDNNGLMVITTPNANKLRKVVEILTTNNYSVNMEHTMWLCPKTILEVVHRAGLRLEEFYWMKEVSDRKKTGLIRHLVNRFYDFISLLWTNFNANFMIIVRTDPLAAQ